jgi:hypothetical protein
MTLRGPKPATGRLVTSEQPEGGCDQLTIDDGSEAETQSHGSGKSDDVRVADLSLLKWKDRVSLRPGWRSLALLPALPP